VAAARAVSSVLQTAQEFPTENSDTFNVPLAATHGTAAWVAELGSYTASDETITQASLTASKAGTKILVSEELPVR
jgi:HK97 family phage major capsid protein